MIGNVIQKRFLIPDYPRTSALSFMLMAVILIIVTIYIRKAGTDEVV
jgi:spermidine/putrescine transport system permease protein